MRSTVLALLLFAAPAVLAAPPPEARAQKEQGDRLRKGGDVGGATTAYQAALTLDGGYAEAHEALGEIYFASKQLTRAIESFGFAVEIDPSYALAWYNLAFAARRAGDQPRARVAYEKYVKLRPTDADGHYGLAETQRTLGNRDAAIAEYQLFIDLARTTPAQAAWVEKARAAQAELKGGAPAAPAAPAATTAPAAITAPTAINAPAATPAPATTTGRAAITAPAAAPAPAATTAPTATIAPAPVPVAPPPIAPVTIRAVPVADLPPAPAPTPPPGPPPPGPPPPATVAPVVAAPAPATPTPAAPSRALIEKLGAGDRAYLSGEFRPALFAYQDAVYLDPTSAVARIKLARAYAALGHKDQAERQLKQALELDPGNDDARKLMEDLARPAPAAPPPAPAVTAVISPPAPAPAPGAPPAQRVYRLTDDAGSPPPADASRPGPGTAVAAAAPAASQPGGDQQEASRHYRAALTMIGARDFKGAIIELDRALESSPQLGVAIAARASAFYGLGRYQDAARDYETALVMVPQLATPLYGLAETYRHLDDPRAGEYYARYAQSDANDVRPELRETARKRAAQLGAQ